jgi:hypothetical protein
VSITVVVNDGQNDQTHHVDIAHNCMLVWGAAGWDVLADYYDKVKKDPAMAKDVRDRKCPKAKAKNAALIAGASMTLTAGASPAVIAMKTPECMPTQWP